MDKVSKFGTPVELLVPTLYEKEVRMFYHNLTISVDGLYLTTQVNGVSIVIDEEMLSKILGVPTKGDQVPKE